MRRFLAYFLLIAYLFSFSQVRQLHKLPNLVEHYLSHELRDKNTTIFSFIKMHYLDEQVKDSDYKQDMKLPFKTHEHSSASTTAFTVPPKIIVSNAFSKSFIHKEIHNFSYSEHFYPAIYLNIWQPPKV